MGLNTLDIQLPGAGSGSGEGYKGINPGNYKAKINKIQLWERPWAPEENALFLVLNLETMKPSPDFEGYPVDENNPDGEKHEGYVGNVKISSYAFKDGVHTRTGKEISRDREILAALLGLCTELGIEEWFRAANGKYNTIESWVEAFNADKPYANKFLEFCIGAEEYVGKDGKTKKTLFLPKSEKINGEWHSPYKSLTSIKPLLTYVESMHFKKAKTKAVEDFKVDNSTINEAFDMDGFDM